MNSGAAGRSAASRRAAHRHPGAAGTGQSQAGKEVQERGAGAAQGPLGGPATSAAAAAAAAAKAAAKAAPPQRTSSATKKTPGWGSAVAGPES